MIRLRSSSRKIIVALFFLTLGIVVSTIFMTGFLRNHKKCLLVVRVDDIQDFAFREAQFFLLNYSAKNKIPVSLAVISGLFGQDPELLEEVQKAVASGSEVGVHGWKHENLVDLSLMEQMAILFQAKNRLKELLGVDTRLLIPPMFSFDNNTITAMLEESYTTMSTCIDLHKPESILGIRNIPATVELSVLIDGVWQLKSVGRLKTEVIKSNELYGYAVIVTHPQEFILNGQIDQTARVSFINLIAALSETSEFTTFENLDLEIWQS